jgi:hypothetical protein
MDPEPALLARPTVSRLRSSLLSSNRSDLPLTALAFSDVALFTQLSAWLASVGRQAIVSETGAADNGQLSSSFSIVPTRSDLGLFVPETLLAGCITALGSQLKYIASQSSTILGFTVWSVSLSSFP